MMATPRFWVLSTILVAALAATISGANFAHRDASQPADPTQVHPGPWYTEDEVQLFVPSAEFKLPKESAALEQRRTKAPPQPSIMRPKYSPWELTAEERAKLHEFFEQNPEPLGP
jgi:hypothetical protein